MCCTLSWSTLECLQIWWTHTHRHTHTHTHTSVIIILLNLKPASRDINGLTKGISYQGLILCVYVCRPVCSWFQCGTVSCVVSIAASWGWLGPTFHWHLNHVSTFRYPCHFSNRLKIITQNQSSLLWWFCLLKCIYVFLHITTLTKKICNLN